MNNKMKNINRASKPENKRLSTAFGVGVYDPKKVEDKIYKEWEKSGFFNPDNLDLSKDAKSYTITLPPPNITDKLHIGHAVMLAVEDLLIRYHRMKGYRTLWVPGTDHAAIATQNVVEKKLHKEEGKTRHDLGKEKFLKKVWEYALEKQSEILEQTKKMGASLDWSREAFTLDDERKRAVTKMFVDMYNAGAIYRGKRIVNWCPRCHSTLADDEVEYEEEKGKFYWIKYGPFILATVRPETKLGDTAVAVNPKDKRYKDMVGKKYKIPGVLGEFEIIVIADRHVDPEFGSGVVKVTPAHDFADYEMAQKNNIPMKQVINEDGKMMENTGKYAGMTTSEARKAIVADMEKMGLIDHIDDDYVHNVAVCYRCGTVIEPIPSKQWFIAVDKKLKRLGNKSLKEKAVEVVKNGNIKFTPERFTKSYLDWMNNMHDWCISRQIWFGHEIPVYFKNISSLDLLEKYKKGKKEFKVGEKGSPVHAKKEKEYRVSLSNEEDFEWFIKNFKEKEDYEYVDYFDGKNRTRVSEKNNSFTIIPKKSKKKGVVGKKGKKGEIDGIYATIEERSTSGLARYEAEFKGGLPEYFKNHKQISSVDILDYQNEEKTDSSMLVSSSDPIFDGWKQDEDSLDTWFSSGMWTFSTLGWPDTFKNGKKSGDLARFHPTQVLETGYDILTLWVSRMIMMSLFAVNEIPFKNVYLHGLVRDEKGRKMSKSLGNVIDPREVAEKYGTDAVRLSLLIGNTPGNDLKMSEEKIRSFRNFTNKIWNISRYYKTNVHLDHKQPTRPTSENNIIEIPPGESERAIWHNKISKNATLSDKWILFKIGKLISIVSSDIENFHFSQAGEKLHDFTWNDFADWYLEISKIEKNEEKNIILSSILTDLLRMWHPFMPFVTEAIWKEIGNNKLLMIEKWPSQEKYNFISEKSRPIISFELLQKIIIAIRNARVENKIDTKKKIKVIIDTRNSASGVTELVTEQKNLIESLRTKCEVEIKNDGKKVPNSIHRTTSGINIYIPTEGLVDVEKEKKRSEKEIENLEKHIAGIESKLKNKGFLAKAPEEIVNQQKESLERAKSKLKEIKRHRDSIS